LLICLSGGKITESQSKTLERRLGLRCHQGNSTGLEDTGNSFGRRSEDSSTGVSSVLATLASFSSGSSCGLGASPCSSGTGLTGVSCVVDTSTFDLRRRRYRRAATIKSSAPTATPAPIPAFAPVDKPLLELEEGSPVGLGLGLGIGLGFERLEVLGRRGSAGFV